MTDLPKFSGVVTDCPKCATNTKHQVRHDNTAAGECMIRHCLTCGYTWNEQPADAKPGYRVEDKPRGSGPDILSWLLKEAGNADLTKIFDNLKGK